MSTIFINKSNFIETYFKNKYALFIIIFAFGIIILLHYMYVKQIQTKLIESYTTTELKTIADKMDEVDKTPEKRAMNLSALLKGDLSDIIKRLFGARCLPGCMSPDNTNRKDSMCKKNVTEYGVTLDCPWRCNITEFNEQMDTDLMFKQNILSNNLKMCSVDNENIDCGGCLPLRSFE
jgi:hypothetical protein